MLGADLAKLKAVLFDLHGTLAYVPEPVSDDKITEYLFSRGYEVSPQQLKAALSFVSFIDYPKYGYRNCHSFFRRIFWRLRVKVDEQTLNKIVELLETHPYQLYSDAIKAVTKAKKNGFRTAIVTTIAKFKFRKAIEPIEEHFDFVMTGYEAGCDKTNPKMYTKVLQILKVKPSEAVMIGDDIPIDISLPKRLGMNAILLNRKGDCVNCPQADAIVGNLNEAVETVIRAFNRAK